MNPILAATILLALLAVGEILSIMTRARVPGFLVTFVLFFVLLQTDVLPDDLVDVSTFALVGSLLAPALLVHMGTLLPMKIIRQQYKAVLIAICGLIGAAVVIVTVVTPIFGYASAVAGTGPIAGGPVAYLVTSNALQEAGLTALVAIPLLAFVLQQLVGLPLVTNLLRRHAVRFRAASDQRQPLSVAVGGEDVDRSPSGGAAEGTGADLADSAPPPPRPMIIPERFTQSGIVLLFMVFVGGLIAVGLEAVTGLSYTLWGLAIGIAGAFFRIYPAKALEKANGFTVAVVGLLIVVLSAAGTITLEQLLDLLPVVAAIVVAGTAGLMLGGYIGSKIVKWDPHKGVPVALTALIGFPLDYIVTSEVSRSAGRTPQERDALLDDMMPPMVIGGFATVTTGSVVIATLLVQTL